MKKILLTALCAMMTLVAGAKDYTETLVVTINGESTEPQQAIVHVDTNTDGTIKFSLDNFCLDSEDGPLNVGNIAVDNLQLTKGSAYDTFSFEGNTVITAGNKEGVAEEEWAGPFLGEVPLVLRGKINDNKLYVTIDIDMMESIQQIIYVEVGTDIGAKDYIEQLVVTINEERTAPQNALVHVTTNGDGTIKFSLDNFCLDGEDGPLNVGNIAVDNLQLTKGSAYDTFSFEGNIVITAGNKEGVAEDEWAGPFLGEVPLVLRGKINDNKLYVTIDIDMMESLQQIIYVEVGTDFPSSVSVVDVAKKVNDMKEGKATKAEVEGVVNSVLNK